MNAVLILALFILLRGSEGNVLKLLQQTGGDHISFCNVFFFSSLITGLAMLTIDHVNVKTQIRQLSQRDRKLLFWQGFLGYFLGPVGFFLALEHLSVVAQTLLFSLTIPLSTVAARVFLHEKLPKQFPLALILICLGIFLGSQSAGGAMTMLASEQRLEGVIWAAIAIFSFAIGGILNSICSSRGMGVGLTVGVGSTSSALVFAVLALLFYGPQHFITLEEWWVLSVIGLYGITISLGSQWTLMLSYQSLGVAQISLWSSLTLIVALLGANLLLGEPLGFWAFSGAIIILSGLTINQLSSLQLKQRQDQYLT